MITGFIVIVIYFAISIWVCFEIQSNVLLVAFCVMQIIVFLMLIQIGIAKGTSEKPEGKSYKLKFNGVDEMVKTFLRPEKIDKDKLN